MNTFIQTLQQLPIIGDFFKSPKATNLNRQAPYSVPVPDPAAVAAQKEKDRLAVEAMSQAEPAVVPTDAANVQAMATNAQANPAAPTDATNVQAMATNAQANPAAPADATNVQAQPATPQDPQSQFIDQFAQELSNGGKLEDALKNFIEKVLKNNLDTKAATEALYNANKENLGPKLIEAMKNLQAQSQAQTNPVQEAKTVIDQAANPTPPAEPQAQVTTAPVNPPNQTQIPESNLA